MMYDCIVFTNGMLIAFQEPRARFRGFDMRSFDEPNPDRLSVPDLPGFALEHGRVAADAALPGISRLI